ncbi:retrovirus-related pol polyprotein from transposon TNT 1-94 [Tanacetum coccineum]
MKVEESINVTFDETPPPPKTSPLEDDDLVEEQAIEDKPKNINKALKDESWVIAMQEEINQFISNDVWELIPNPKDMTINGTKWVFRNKLDENGVVFRNKAWLVAQDFKLFQMDVKSAFLNSFINEKVYVAQPSGFIDFVKPNHVYRLKKALYGLKQVPKAWYDRLKAFLIKHDYTMGRVLTCSKLTSPQGDNHTQPPLPPSPSREMLMNNINQLEDLSNLLAMHLSQRNTSSSPYSPNLPHTLNLDQVEQHVGYCPCCIYTQKQFLTLSEDINWIELLLTRPQSPPQLFQRVYPPTDTPPLQYHPPTTN